MSVLRGRPPGFAAGINGARRLHLPFRSGRWEGDPLCLAICAPISRRPHPKSPLKTADDPVNHSFLNGTLPFETGSKAMFSSSLFICGCFPTAGSPNDFFK